MERNFDRDGQKYEERIVQISRVSKKTKGGNKIRFATLVVVGDKNGNVGLGLGKSADVSTSIQKAIIYAKKRMISVPIVNHTIPFSIVVKEGAARVMLKPAPLGTGIIAGGAVRSVVEVAGIRNISSKILGTSNKASNVYATFEALRILGKQGGAKQ
ncbi:MAG: 30S ribosomal protein S5 [Candidatus Levybacteria bacterium]|nr:30S ribosomal protein S5 [Candidatus Levybacteria bacterium]